jgi:DNA-binding MarR family transcriptional regulator
MNQSMVQAVIAKKLDAYLGMHGISFTEFMVLYHLENAPDNKLRRIDLADKTGLSASGITRLIAPMEKIGLVQKESNARDARVSFVRITPAGNRIFDEAASGVNSVATTLLANISQKNIDESLKVLRSLGGTIA